MMARRFDPKVRAAAGRIAAATMLEKYGQYFPPGACSEGGKKGSHVLWHVLRGRINPKCQYCPVPEDTETT